MSEVKLIVEEEFCSDDAESRKTGFLCRLQGIIEGKRVEVLTDSEMNVPFSLESREYTKQ
ncbi:MAG: hypothetical protein ACOX1Q_01565 [Eubacteriales bacterium]|jgi:hypothetical protein